MDQFHAGYVDALWLEEEPHHVWVEVKGHLGSPGVIPENRINTIESSLPNIHRPPKMLDQLGGNCHPLELMLTVLFFQHVKITFDQLLRIYWT